MNAAARLVEVRVPDMGNFKDVDIIDVLVKPGESIEPEAPLVTLETEKATMDVPSTVGGVIEQVHIAKGGKVSTGDLIATVRSTTAAPAGGAASEPDSKSARAEAPSLPAGAGAKPAESPGSAASGRQAASPGRAEGGGAAARPAASGAAVQAAASAHRPGTSDPRRESASAARDPGEAVSARPMILGLPDDEDEGDQPSRHDMELPPINEPGFSRAHASPSVRKFARELGVDLTRVGGGGFKGRVTHDDVKAFVKKHLTGPSGAAGAGPAAAGSLPVIPVVDFAQFGPVEIQPLSRIQRISGPRLHASWVNIPHVTQFEDADITELEAARGQLKQKALQEGIKLTPLAFIFRACVRALQEFPLFNSSLDPSGVNLIVKRYLNIGFAADTPNGLVVPVMREVNRKDVYEIARQLGELSEKARAGRLSPMEIQGAGFTISSLGGIGGTAFTPIINAPEVAILGISRSAMRPVYRDGTFVPRLILPLSLSYDHRVIDGALAARFTAFLAQTLADPRPLLEAVP